MHYTATGGADTWDPLHYLNIWVADMGDNVVGRATFPGEAPPAEDGVVIDPRYFGTTGLAAGSEPYHLGRTTVHEIGHYFNLLHPWGSGLPSCDGDDEVEDTPLTSNNYLQECPSTLQASCGSLDMYTNYMYYTNDPCLAQFTPGQKVRILATLAGPRAALTNSTGCQPSGTDPGNYPVFKLLIQPNPSPGQLVFECKGKEGKSGLLQIWDPIGRLLYETAISTNQPYTWEAPATWADGVYFVQAEVEEEVVVRRFVLRK
ncbi:MAG: hypothetical protein IPJ40_12915 [Saprospirales bacterium]|nr:hypothetical protein [Saprospirales bacterium]